jgi:hypothetical protein
VVCFTYVALIRDNVVVCEHLIHGSLFLESFGAVADGSGRRKEIAVIKVVFELCVIWEGGVCSLCKPALKAG